MEVKKQPVISLRGEELVATVVVQEEVKAAAMPFAAAKEGRRGVYFMDETGLVKNIVPDIMDASKAVSEQTVIETLNSITEGIPAPKAKAIHDSVLSSNNVVDSSDLLMYEPTADDIAEIQGIYDAMIKQLEEMRGTGGGKSATGKLAKYFFKKHILLQGEKGGGKTYAVSKMISEMDDDIKSIDIRGNEGIEAIDLLGYYIKTNDGNLVWKDGPLTKAFRSAASGTKTVLFIDEMLRIPKRELNVLVGSLSPDSEGNFRLDTNQADSVVIDENGKAIASTETLVVPKDMLWCVGTTNAGAGYSVDTIDEALGDRFRTLIKRTGEKEMQTILLSIAKEYGHDKKMVTKLMKFYKSFNTLKDSGELTKLVNLRHLAEILEFSEDESDVPDVAMDLIPTWCTQDQHGYPNETQEAIIEGIIEKELV